MSSKLLLIMTLFFVGFCASAQTTAGAEGLSLQARNIVKMTQAGIDEAILLSYVKADREPFSLSKADIETLKTLGVTSNVIAEMLRRDAELKGPAISSAGTISEDQLFRIRGGFILYDSRLYPIQPALDPSIRSILQGDPVANRDILAFERSKASSQAAFWGGLGFIIGGPLYGAIANSYGFLDRAANSGIVMGAIGCGVISWIICSVTNSSARVSLYNGLSQYNRDLIVQGNGG